MSKLTTAQKVDQIHEYIVGNPLKNLPGVDNILKLHSKTIIDQQKEIEELKRNKADKFEWKKLFSIFIKAKSITP